MLKPQKEAKDYVFGKNMTIMVIHVYVLAVDARIKYEKEFLVFHYLRNSIAESHFKKGGHCFYD